MTATSKSSSTPSKSTPHTKNVFRIHGVNVLNRKNVDSIARLTAMERRRATHILDERQRRDTMNQLLTELASLVRESASDIDSSSSSTASLLPSQQPTLNSDGIERRPPVKSNSITTLRNAITEIRRLRACAGLQQIHQAALLTTSNNIITSPHMTTTSAPLSSRRSSSRSTSPSLSDLTSLATLAELAASQHVSGSDSNPGSCNSSPMSSPKSSSRRALSPTEANAHPHLHIVGDGGGFVFGGTNGSGNNSGSGSGNGRGRGSSNLLEPLSTQLYSPPLSPSSPTASSSSTFQNHFSAILPAVSNTPPNICGDGSHQAPPTLPPIHTMVQPASFHPYQQQQQQQQQQQSYTSMFCTPSSSVLSSSQNNPDAMSPTSIFSESSIARSPPTPSIYNPISSFPPL